VGWRILTFRQFITLTFKKPKLNNSAITTFCDIFIIKRLSTLPGNGSIENNIGKKSKTILLSLLTIYNYSHYYRRNQTGNTCKSSYQSYN